jgi:hypothetical protein
MTTVTQSHEPTTDWEQEIRTLEEWGRRSYPPPFTNVWQLQDGACR